MQVIQEKGNKHDQRDTGRDGRLDRCTIIGQLGFYLHDCGKISVRILAHGKDVK